MTLYGFENATIIYAGAAPGQHTNYLSNLFPDMKFILIDPSPFQTKATERIDILHDTYFDDNLAQELKKKCDNNILFISDIRSFSNTTKEKNQKEDRCEIDMENQKRWHLILSPKASMLKLRFPYKPGITKYLEGDIFFPVWGPMTTTECRLIATSSIEKEYDHTDYEQMMFHFNTHFRTSYWV